MQLILNLDEAAKARDAGIAQAITNADSVSPGWSEKAYEFLLEFIRSNDRPFMMEDVRSYAALMDFPLPPSARAWGGAIVRAARAGLVIRCGYQNTTNVRAHRTPATLWRKNNFSDGNNI